MSGGEAGVRVEMQRGGAVARVVVDREHKLNALDTSMLRSLATTLRLLGRGQSLRAVVLRGAGERAFVGGADIAEMAAIADGEAARDFITLVHDCCRALRDLPVPVIARIDGVALGAGLELAASCDLRLAADRARFGMPEVLFGIPSVVEASLLPGLIGWGRTRRLLLLGEVIDAAEAERWCLVERVVPAASLDEAVEQWLEMLLAAGPRALRSQKALIRQWEGMTPDAGAEAGIDAFAAAWDTDEPQRLLRRFAERRRQG